MKLTRVVASIAVVAALSLTPMAHAQTCAAPGTWQPDSTGQPSLSQSTCGGDNSAVAYCAGAFPATGPAYILKLHTGPSGTFSQMTVEGGGAGFNPIAYVSSASAGCGVDAPCVASGNVFTSQQLPEGDYYFAVTAQSTDGAGACGIFQLVIDGSLPVGLQNFSVE
jgi:hypothetical protein